MSRPLLAPPPEVLEAADRLSAQGYSLTEISRSLGWPPGVLRHALARERRQADAGAIPGGGD